MNLRLLLHSILVTQVLRSERVERGGRTLRPGEVPNVHAECTPKWRAPKCYIVNGALRRRFSKGVTSPSVNKLNGFGVSPVSSEYCSGDETKRNEHYEAYIRNVCEELQRMIDREDKMKHLMRENTNACKVNFAEPVDRKKFTLRDNSKLDCKRRKYFINEVREGVYYRYVERCNSNLYVAVDVVECGGGEEEGGCEVHSRYPINDKSIRPDEYAGDRPHWRSILGRKKFSITIDGFSDNVVLSCFLQVLLKGLHNLDLERFLNMGFEEVVNQLSRLYTIHVNGESIVEHVVSRVQRFLERLCRGVSNEMVNKSSLSRQPARKNMRMHQYPRVAHMLSGGVDSLMALRLLEKKKFYVHNFFLHFAHQECSKSDLRYVKKICSKRKNLFIVNINEEYTEQVLIPMLRSYADGQIPNADIMCNEKVKYNLLMRKMKKLCRERGGRWDYSYVSTGHYAMISTNDVSNANKLFSGNFPYVGDDTDGKMPRRTPRKRYKLVVGRDVKKDQTFFLSSLSEEQLSKFLFPLCLHRKSDIKMVMERREAGKYNQRETRGLCLYGRVDMHSLLGLYLGGGGMSRERRDRESERGLHEKESVPVEANLAIERSTLATFNHTARGLQWEKDQVRSPEFRAFQEKHLPSFNLRFKNHIINVEDGTVMDTNEGIHLYAIGQKKHITNYLHELYNSKGRNRTCEKNYISSCQWTVVYKKMFKRASGNVKENFIYLSRNYGSSLFRYLRVRCKLGDFRWVASSPPSYLRQKIQDVAKEGQSEVTEGTDGSLKISPTRKKMGGRSICIKVRNSEKIKEAKITLDDSGKTGYLTLREKDIGLSPGQIVTFYLPFIVKRNGKTKYVYSLRRRGGKKERPTFFHCLGSARIINQYLNRSLYLRLMGIHRKNNLPLWGRDTQCGLLN